MAVVAELVGATPDPVVDGVAPDVCLAIDASLSEPEGVETTVVDADDAELVMVM